MQKIKRDAEAFPGDAVAQAVVTVPASCDDNQRSATRDACRIAGLELARLVNEPTAAALAYGLGRLGQEVRIAVIDLGGGTLDITIMEFGKGVFEVKAQVPGVSKDQLQVNITDDTLTLKGEMNEEEKKEDTNFHRQEFRYGAFERTIALPMAVQADKATAQLKDGVLEITLPKSASAQANVKQIPIQAS